MCKPGVVEATMVEISPVLSFEKRTIVFEVETIPVVAVPGRIIIIGIPWKIGFTDGGSDIDPGCGDANANAGSDKYLGITFCRDQARGYNRCKDE